MGHGFFIKFFKGNEDFYCLMTNDHVITEDMLNQKKTIRFYYDLDSKSVKFKEINLNSEERYIKYFKKDLNIDAIIIEILPKDNIDKDYFLLPFLEHMDNSIELKDKEISIIQKREAESAFFIINGEIKDIKKYEFTHNTSTLQISLGCLIFLKESIKVVGICKGDTYSKNNFGDFIGPIFNFFKYKFK